MKIGDLVKWWYFGDFGDEGPVGIAILGPRPGSDPFGKDELKVLFADGTAKWLPAWKLEVVNESR